MTTEAEPGVIRPQPQDTGNPETGRGRKDAPPRASGREICTNLVKVCSPRHSLTMAYPKPWVLSIPFFFSL